MGLYHRLSYATLFACFTIFLNPLLSFAQQAENSKDYSQFGFVRVAAATPILHLGSPLENAQETIALLNELEKQQVAIALFPEMGITGYTLGDAILNQEILTRSREAVKAVLKATRKMNSVAIIGAPYQTADGRLYNVAFVLHAGRIVGAVPKIHLPNYSEFYDARWFTSGKDVNQNISDPLLGDFLLSAKQIFSMPYTQDNTALPMQFGVEICEDLWAVNPPDTDLALAGAQIIFNPSASPELVGKARTRRQLLEVNSGRLIAGYVYASSGPGESSQDLVFGGHRLILENGAVLAESELFDFNSAFSITEIDVQKIQYERRMNKTFGSQLPNGVFSTSPIPYRPALLESLVRKIPSTPFFPQETPELLERTKEAFNIQTAGLVRRLKAVGSQRVVIGVSGGSDSTLALLVAAKAADIMGWKRSQILGVTMPGLGTTKKTKDLAHQLMNALGIEVLEIPIEAAVLQHFADIGHDPAIEDVTFENAQARERTQILYDLANKYHGIVLGTGDLSEICLGWCTLNADQTSMYNVNSSIPKTLVKAMIFSEALRTDSANLKAILSEILQLPISPELTRAQKGQLTQITEDKIGPYELHDFFIYGVLRNQFSPTKIFALAELAFAGKYDSETISKWLNLFIKRFSSQQFKRTPAPPGPKVGSVSVSPRGDWRLPDDLMKPYLDQVPAPKAPSLCAKKFKGNSRPK